MLGTAGLIASACDSDRPAPGVRCGDLTVPGSIVQLPGIQLSVRTPQGLPAANGTSVSATSVGTTAIGVVVDSLLSEVFVGPGTYSARITRPFYKDTTVSNIVVLAGDCTPAQTTKLAVVLSLAAGAPPVRSVSVFGQTFLATPGSQARMVALVDADAGVSHTVTWRLTDTTMARVDASGLVTSRCSTRGGTDTVTATSVADPTVTGRSTFGIGASASCP